MGRKKLFQPSQVMAVLQRWIAQEGQAPTIEELRQLLNLGSSRTVLQYLKDLEETGHIKRWAGARGIKILRHPIAGAQTRSVPVLGRVAAGVLNLAEQDLDGWLRLPVEELTPKTATFFLLRVHGDSMNRAMVEGGRIADGDLVLVRQQGAAELGSIVVALVDGEATVKRLNRLPGYYVLQPDSSNPGHKPILVRSDFSVQGVVTKVIKKGAQLLESPEDAADQN